MIGVAVQFQSVLSDQEMFLTPVCKRETTQRRNSKNALHITHIFNCILHGD